MGGEEFYEELLLPCGGSLREGLVGPAGDGLSWLSGASDLGCLTIVG